MSTTVVLHPVAHSMESSSANMCPVSSAECAVISLGGDLDNGVLNIVWCP